VPGERTSRLRSRRRQPASPPPAAADAAAPPAPPPSCPAEEEKAYVRGTAMAVLLQDTSERVALQTGLLITNIARFDFPRPWASLLADLAAAAAVDSAVPLPAKARALTTLKHVLRALRNKRFVMEAPSGYDVDGAFRAQPSTRSGAGLSSRLHHIFRRLAPCPPLQSWTPSPSASTPTAPSSSPRSRPCCARCGPSGRPASRRCCSARRDGRRAGRWPPRVWPPCGSFWWCCPTCGAWRPTSRR
jgi:hypothetical protein